MSAATKTDTPTESPPTEKPPAARKPGRVSRFVRRLGNLSLPARAAVVTAILLLLLILMVLCLYLLNPDHVPWRHSLSLGRIVAVLLLAIAIPWVVYNGLRLWLEGDHSQFPEIDFAWRAGLDALEQGGLSIETIPVFLVLGSSGERFERSLLAAARGDFRVRGVPEGPAPVHWYANPDWIVLVCSEVGWLSAFAALVAQKRARAMAEESIADAAPSPSRPDPSSAEPKQTRDSAKSYASSSLPEAKPSVLTRSESAEQLERLRYVCRLIRGARRPLCGINGLLTLLPFDSFVPARRDNDSAPWREGEECQNALRADLATVQEELRLQCNVMTLIVGMEQVRGFRELVRRVGRERTETQRLGRDFDLRALPSRDAFTAKYTRGYSTLEDWIYTLFRDQGVLSRPGNRQLYSLLCNFRSNFKSRLAALLAGGYGYDPQQPSDEPILYGGCYFAATGDTEDRQAFVRGVFDRLGEQQDEVQWTQAALSEERRDRRLAVLGFGVCALLLAILGAMILQPALG